MLHGYGASLLEGALLSLTVALSSLVIAFALGLAGAVAKLSRVRPLRWLAQAYTTLIRAVPDLVMMLLVFYGGQVLVNHLGDRFGWDYVDVDPFVAGVLTIGFIFGAYFTEVLRGAFLAVPPGQKEAALAFGMTPRQVLWRIVGPQMLRHALPGALVPVTFAGDPDAANADFSKNRALPSVSTQWAVTEQVTLRGNELKETRGPARRVGVRLGPDTRRIILAENRFAGFSVDVEDKRPADAQRPA